MEVSGAWLEREVRSAWMESSQELQIVLVGHLTKERPRVCLESFEACWALSVACCKKTSEDRSSQDHTLKLKHIVDNIILFNNCIE